MMTIEKGLRPTSPVHVHVEDDVPVHLHVKKKTKAKSSAIKKPGLSLTGSVGVRGKTKKSTARARSKSPGEDPWIPAPGKTSKASRVSWQGPSHRLEANKITLEDLDTDDEDRVHGKMKGYENKISNLMNEVNNLKSEAMLKKTLDRMEEKDAELNSSKRILEVQEAELNEYREELTATERENNVLRKRMDFLSDEADITRAERDIFSAERETLMKQLIEVEMDGQAASKQISELRDSFRKLREENRISAVDSAKLAKTKDLLLEKLADFEATNRTLRRLLRDQHRHEAAAVRLDEQRDILLRRLTDADKTNDHLKRDLLDKDFIISELQSKLMAHESDMDNMRSLQSSIEGTRAHLQKQLRSKEGDCNRMAVQIRTLESEIAQNKIDMDHLQQLVSTAKDRSGKDKEALKKATRVQKQRAERSQDALEKMRLQLMEKDNQSADLQAQLTHTNLRFDKLHKERAQSTAEKSALKMRTDELENLVGRVEDKTRIQLDEASSRLHEKATEISDLQLENDRLKSSISSMECKYAQSEKEVVQLQSNLKQYETLIDEYRGQMNMSRREADDTLVRLEEQQKGDVEIEKVKYRLHQRLQELEPLPELLRSAEIRLQDANDRLLTYEKKNTENTKFITELTAKVENLSETLEQMRDKYHSAEDENRLLHSRIESVERKFQDTDSENRDLRSSLSKKEDTLLQNTLRLEERTRENGSLTRQLENALTDIRRHHDDSKEKHITKERTFHSRIIDLESQLSQTRADIARIKREKEEAERKCSSQIYDLKDRLEQSHSTNRSMQNYVQFLKNSYANVFGETTPSTLPITPMRPFP